jgi:hypothetical protein
MGAKETMMLGPRFWRRTSRRPSFWLGLFVACFLAWAWWDSYQREPLVHVTTRREALQLSRIGGVTMVATGPIPDMPYWGFWGVGSRPLAGGPETLGHQRGREQRWAFARARGVRYLKIPDSLVLFSFLGLWVGWLAFSEWLRKKRSGRTAGEHPG